MVEDDPKNPGALAELELRSHFGGRRGGCRVLAQFKAAIRTDSDNFSAQTIDVSRTGILLEISENVYDGEDLGAFADAVQEHFGGATRVVFSQLQVEIRASLVRVMVVEGRLRLAFQFERVLSLPLCDLLQLPLGADRDAETGS